MVTRPLPEQQPLFQSNANNKPTPQLDLPVTNTELRRSPVTPPRWVSSETQVLQITRLKRHH